MSYLKINPDLFLGSQELNRLKEFLDDRGFRKILLQDSLSFGVVNNSKSGNFDNFRVEQGTNTGTIKHADGIAIDKNGKLITKSATDNFPLINDNAWYWIKIKHQFSSLEIGTVSVDVNGNLTGTGTEFLKVLRGAPNNPVKIKFSGAVSNIGEYYVTEVVNDISAILAGDFLAESNLKLIVVGAFTPGIVVPSDSKEIYQYDHCLMTLVAETVSETPPALLADEEFVIARVKRNGSTVVIEDKRTSIYKSKADYTISLLPTITNPLFGIESIRYNDAKSTREMNIVNLAWGFRSDNWTVNTNTNLLTLNAGKGGKFKSTVDFTDGDFDGWKVYINGYDAVVKSSYKSGTQINLILDTLDFSKFSGANATSVVSVTPNAEEIILLFLRSGESADGGLSTKEFSFPINSYAPTSHIVELLGGATYSVYYKLKNHNKTTAFGSMPADTVVGYLNETAFNDAGVAINTNKTTYASNIITLLEAPNSYINRVNGLDTGDLFGTEHLIMNNTSPIVDYQVSVKKQYQIVETKAPVDGGQGNPFVLSVDHYINLKKTGVSNLKGGNAFIFQFKGNFTPGSFNIIFTQDYVNPGNPGVTLYTLTSYDYAQSLVDNLLFRCIYDSVDAKWVVYRMIHNQAAIDISGKADKTITVTAGDGLTGGGTLGANFSLAVNSTVVRTTRSIVAGDGLTGGGDLSSDRTLAVQVDNSTLEISADTVRIKDAGVTAAKLASGAAVSNIGYTPVPPSRNVIAGSGLTGGGGLSTDITLDVNVDNSTLEISADVVRVKDGGITAAKIAAQSAWQNITLNGGAGYVAGSRTPQYRIDTLGRIHLRGIISISGSPPAGDHAVSGAAALPLPSQRHDLSNVNSSLGTIASFYVDTAGTMRADSSISWGGTVVLDGLGYWPS